MLDLTVVKRFVSFALAFVFAAQLLAGICMCLSAADDNHGKTSCCKSKKSEQAAMSSLMGCCREACGDPTGGLPGSANASSVQISAPVLAAVENLLADLHAKSNFKPLIAISKRAGVSPQLFIKPPNLYLRGHAFLI
ncbi:MAG TPA: hypothetical protein VEQ34_07335 [Pyrinomonadaceae bacterium]|nr:hypothetical protein [Pyrinomonadaceae bacterium]